MVEKKEVSIGLGSGWVFLALLAFILAYFQYDFSVTAGLGMILVAFALCILSLVGLVPFAGVFIYYLVAVYWLLPRTLAFTGLEWSWIIDIFLYFNLVLAGVMTLFTSFYTYEAIT